MKILMLVNWKIKYCREKPVEKQPPDYYVTDEPYWFFRYFKEPVQVDVIDIHSTKWLENFEKNIVRFYTWQTIKVLRKLGNYDLIISHGMQSGVVLSLWRRIFKTKAKHIVFDIGSFNSAAESGFALKLMRFVSKSINGLIYHTSSQIEYYKKFFPWIIDKSYFVRFGTDLEFFKPTGLKRAADAEKYIICVGYSKRDWNTVVAAYQQLVTDVKLRLVGHVTEKYNGISGIEQISSVSIKELINQIYNARFCVLPLKSFNYSYGQMTLLQQMSLGKCVIAAKVPSLIDYIENEKTAVMYRPENVDDLKSKMQMLLDDPKTGSKIAEMGKKYLLDECNERIMAENIEKIIKKIYLDGTQRQQ